MRPIWKGAVTFGLVSVPVKMYTATVDHDVELHMVHAADGGRIRYRRTCEACGQEVPSAEIVKAHGDDGQLVMLSEEDLAALPVARKSEIEVVEFVPREQVDPIRFERSYYLEPATPTAKAYVLLREVLARTERTAIVHVTLRNRSRLAALRAVGDVLTIHTLLWDDEVREVDFPVLHDAVQITKQELDVSAMLVDSLSEDFSPQKFVDDYQVQLRELIARKHESGEVVVQPAAADQEGEGVGGDVVDLMEALKRSVEEAQRSHPAKSSRAKKSAPTRAPRRKKAG